MVVVVWLSCHSTTAALASLVWFGTHLPSNPNRSPPRDPDEGSTTKWSGEENEMYWKPFTHLFVSSPLLCFNYYSFIFHALQYLHVSAFWFRTQKEVLITKPFAKYLTPKLPLHAAQGLGLVKIFSPPKLNLF